VRAQKMTEKIMRYLDWRQTAKRKVSTNMLVTGDDLNCPI